MCRPVPLMYTIYMYDHLWICDALRAIIGWVVDALSTSTCDDTLRGGVDVVVCGDMLEIWVPTLMWSPCLLSWYHHACLLASLSACLLACTLDCSLAIWIECVLVVSVGRHVCLVSWTLVSSTAWSACHEPAVMRCVCVCACLLPPACYRHAFYITSMIAVFSSIVCAWITHV